jgi:hypothetical protein
MREKCPPGVHEGEERVETGPWPVVWPADERRRGSTMAMAVRRHGKVSRADIAVLGRYLRDERWAELRVPSWATEGVPVWLPTTALHGRLAERRCTANARGLGHKALVAKAQPLVRTAAHARDKPLACA